MIELIVCFIISYTPLESIYLGSCLNVKERLAQNKRDIGNLTDFNGTWTHNHLVWKRTLEYLAKMVKRLSCAMSTSLHGVSIMSEHR